MVKRRAVNAVDAGSNPVLHPKLYAKIAQLVEHRFEASGVVGSIPTLGTILKDIL